MRACEQIFSLQPFSPGYTTAGIRIVVGSLCF